MKIRPALQADAGTLIALDSFAATEPARREEIVQWIGSGWAFMAERAGMALGYGVVHGHFFGRDFLELVMVGMAHRGQGIGTALIHHALISCRSDSL